ncbi:type I restriction enzyme S subunit [Streptomyces olivoverticillatus]|uniref:Type I restriction enzyme S subunit n=1 Tax=Streptomyces olivoverticillatus TaxID=66427 RepID=A0A7W7PMN1_9ACTN|nr:restriction endonuclease subunit S [Streptomyces olivoverticillatus]MBB4895549.1 type I restriction enzyme S subunit [Streptomyces olivoverticillatus]
MSDWQQISLGDLEAPARQKVSVPPQRSRASVCDGYPLRPLGEVMRLDIQRTPMKPATTYRLAGVLNAGKGVVAKGELDGGDTEYAAMNVLHVDQVVMRKLTAWEGPITVVPAEFDGFVVSNEFPTFTLGPELMPAWMRHVCGSPRLWAEMKNRVSGTVQRRKRLNPEQLLQIQLPIPPREVQARIVEMLDAVDDQIAALDDEAEALDRVSMAVAEDMLAEEPTVALGTMLNDIRGGKSPQANNRPPGADELGVLKVSAVTPFAFLPEESKSLLPGTFMPESALVQPGDVLITRANTPLRVGAVARVPADVRDGLYLADKTLRLVPSSELDPDFLVVAMALKSARTHLTSSATGTSASMVNVSQDRIRDTPIPLADLDRQREVSSAVLSVRTNTDAVRAEAARLRNARSSLLSGLLDRTIDIESAELEV